MQLPTVLAVIYALECEKIPLRVSLFSKTTFSHRTFQLDLPVNNEDTEGFVQESGKASTSLLGELWFMLCPDAFVVLRKTVWCRDRTGRLLLRIYQL